jgi:hypothetical protein
VAGRAVIRDSDRNRRIGPGPVSGAAPNPDRPGLTSQGHRDGAGRAANSSLRAARQLTSGPPGPRQTRPVITRRPCSRSAARLGVGAGHAPGRRAPLTGTHRQRACALCVCGMRTLGGKLGLVPSCRAPRHWQAPRQARSTVTFLIPGRSASAGAEVGCTSGGLPVRAPAA